MVYIVQNAVYRDKWLFSYVHASEMHRLQVERTVRMYFSRTAHYIQHICITVMYFIQSAHYMQEHFYSQELKMHHTVVQLQSRAVGEYDSSSISHRVDFISLLHWTVILDQQSKGHDNSNEPLVNESV